MAIFTCEYMNMNICSLSHVFPLLTSDVQFLWGFLSLYSVILHEVEVRFME